MKPLPNLHQLIGRLGKHDFRGRILAIDPGETTGICIIDRLCGQTPMSTGFTFAGQISTWPLESAVENFQRLILEHFDGDWPNVTHCVYEAYHVYSWRLDEHKFSEVPTIQIIGCLKTLLIQRGIQYSRQTAQIGKGFCTDQKLRYWDLFDEGKVHSRDAMRHACHYLLFGQRDTVKD